MEIKFYENNPFYICDHCKKPIVGWGEIAEGMCNCTYEECGECGAVVNYDDPNSKCYCDE